MTLRRTLSLSSALVAAAVTVTAARAEDKQMNLLSWGGA